MKSKGFGKPGELSKDDVGNVVNSLGQAAEVLFFAAQQTQKLIVIPMLPPGNELSLPPGKTAIGRSELMPSCSGLVVAVHCSSEEAQALTDLLMSWQKRRSGNAS